MIIILNVDADLRAVSATLQGLGLWTRPLLGGEGPGVLEVEPHSAHVSTARLLDVEGVADVRDRASLHPRVDALPARYELMLRTGETLILGGDTVLAAGPCAVESEAQIHEAAGLVARAGAKLLRGGAWKPRTSPYGFQGEGEQALRWMAEAAAAHGLGVVTEAMSEAHVDAVAAVADLVQIGSRNMQNFALLQAVGAAGRPVLLKRSRGASLTEWLQAGEHLLVHGAPYVLFCERGIAGAGKETRNTLDVGAIAVLNHAWHLAVAVDPSHAAGRRDLVVPLAKAGVAAGASLVLVEVHQNPQEARSDGPQALAPAQLDELALSLGIARPTVVAKDAAYTSRHKEFYKRSVEDRRAVLAATAGLSADAQAYLARGNLDIALADRMSENVVSTFALPMAVALNFRVNGRDHLVPMVIEEPSVGAAASNAARMVRATGGFRGDATASARTAQRRWVGGSPASATRAK